MNHFSQNFAPIQSKPLTCWDVFSLDQALLTLKQQDLCKLNKLAHTQKWHISWDFNDKLIAKDYTILVVDLRQSIQFVSHNVHSMTGYSAQELLGKSPNILQGEKTEAREKQAIRSAIEARKPFNACLTNYRKSGQTYLCAIEGHPIFNQEEELVSYLAFEQAVD